MNDLRKQVIDICTAVDLPEVYELILKKKELLFSSPKYYKEERKIKLYEINRFKKQTK